MLSITLVHLGYIDADHANTRSCFWRLFEEMKDTVLLSYCVVLCHTSCTRALSGSLISVTFDQGVWWSPFGQVVSWTKDCHSMPCDKSSSSTLRKSLHEFNTRIRTETDWLRYGEVKAWAWKQWRSGAKTTVPVIWEFRSVSEAMSCSQKTNSQMVFSSRCRWQRQGVRWVQGMLDGFRSAHSEK